MPSYPETITADELAKQRHIPTAEIEQDIRDTEAEIALRERFGDMEGANQRLAFVDYLKRLLDARAGEPKESEQ